MRRLPVYLLLDTSGSMAGEPIEAVKKGVQMLVAALRQDPYALETAFLSVITFDSNAEQLVPLTELTTFQMKNIVASGATALGKGLSLLASKIESEVTRTTAAVKGDWKPMVFIMTDGDPTDNWKEGFENLNEQKVGTIVACAAGNRVNTSILKQITEIVVELDTADSASIGGFFKWVSASISTSSYKVESGPEQERSGIEDLPPLPKEINLII